MYTGLLHLHRTTGIITLILVLAAALYFGYRHFTKKPFQAASKKIALFTMIAAHLQLVLGLILYFISPLVNTALADMGKAMKDAALRFWAVEHLSTMLIGIVFITLGYSLSKRATTDTARNKKAFIFFSLGLLAVVLRFPWERLGM